MPTPAPTPTDTQIALVAEITQLDTDTVSSMVASDSTQTMSDAKWALTIGDIATWTSGLGEDAGDIKKVDVIEFFEGKAKETRLDFRNKVRIRYGQTALDEENATVTDAAVIGTSLGWF